MTPICRSALAFLWVWVCCCGPGRAAELPERFEKEIEKAVSKYAEACEKADAALFEAFDRQIAVVRKQPKLKADDKQLQIQALEAEKLTFRQHGTIPFSPIMRADTIHYLLELAEARQPAAKAFDKAIEHLTRAKEDTAAAEKTAEKKTTLPPTVVGVWECVGVNFKGRFVWTLYSDGTASPPGGKNTWTLDKKLVIKNRAPGAPTGGWTDTCTIESDGQTFVARNQQGGAYTGKRIAPSK